MLNHNHPRCSQSGRVIIVGAGPGDPDLLTLRALKAIESADLILFDQLVSREIKALFPPSVPAFFVGKSKGRHSIRQSDLNLLLIKKAKQGKVVVRIKGGDPFIFGRGGEELLTLREAGVRAEVVPGVTAASGCATYAGIPLTHRGLSQGCTLVTGHGETDLNIQWPALVQLNHTLVFYMGISRAALIQRQLLVAGMSENMPVAVIENGCRDNQRVITTRLCELSQKVASNKVKSPALIIVGDVVSLAQALSPSEFLDELNLNQFNTHEPNIHAARLTA